MTMTTTEPLAVREFLYGIDTSVADDARFYESPRVVRFPITKKTARRIYYDAAQGGARKQVRFVDRQVIERDGEVRRRTAGWWEPDGTLYLAEPELTEHARRPDLSELRKAMAAAHPDRGGSDAEFIAARQRYEQAQKRREA